MAIVVTISIDGERGEKLSLKKKVNVFDNDELRKYLIGLIDKDIEGCVV